MMQRGLILPTPMSLTISNEGFETDFGGENYCFGRGPGFMIDRYGDLDDPYIDEEARALKQNIIKGLLFWDEIHIPASQTYHKIPEEDFLISEGIVERPMLDCSFDKMFPLLHLSYLEEKNKEDSIWSIDNTFEFINETTVCANGNDKLSGINRALQVTLYNALPIPSIDVSYTDLLELKLKRYDELVALRVHIDSVYQKILAAGDGELALETEIIRLQKALQDYVQVLKQGNLKCVVSTLRADFELLPALSAGSATYCSTGSLNFALGAALGAGVGRLSISVSKALFSSGKETAPFQYVSSYHDELYWSGRD